MRVAILGNPAGWHVGRLAAALRDRGHEATPVRWSDLAAAIAGADERFAPAAIDTAHLIVVRGMPGAEAEPEPEPRRPAGRSGGRLESVIFRMDVLARLEARGTPVVNRPRPLELAIDKYLSLARLAAAGIAVPRTVVCQDSAAVVRAWEEFGDSVVKPLFGSRGRGLARIDGPAALGLWLSGPGSAAEPAVHYVQEFVRHPGWDARILVVGRQWFAVRRTAAAGDWRTNLSRGGRATPFEPPPGWVDLAGRAATVLGTEVAGVDLVEGADGRPLVLEVNAVPGWRGTAAATGADVAGTIVSHLEAVFAGRPRQDTW